MLEGVLDIVDLGHEVRQFVELRVELALLWTYDGGVGTLLVSHFLVFFSFSLVVVDPKLVVDIPSVPVVVLWEVDTLNCMYCDGGLE